MRSPESRQRLGDIARASVDSLARLNDILDAEDAALRGRESDRIGAVVAEKLAVLRELETLGGELTGLLRQGGRSADRKDMRALLADPALADMRERLQRLLRDCQGKNRVNGTVIELKRALTENLLSILRGEPAGGKTYGRGGKMAAAYSSSHAIAKA